VRELPHMVLPRRLTRVVGALRVTDIVREDHARPIPPEGVGDEGQRSVATVLKADISGSTKLGERLDPEELRGVLGSYFAALAREIHRRGGVVDKYIGDAVVAIFGVPETRADDAARAVVAAVAMQEAIERENIELQRRYGVQLACRIGIATGSVVGGAIAEDVQATYTVVGAPVALAEALESAAPLGSVLVSPATRAAAREAIRFAPLERVHPKGSEAAIPAYRVLGLRQKTRDHVDATRTSGTSASLQVSSDRSHVLAEERKVVTVLFADITSSEPLGAKLDPPRLRTVLGAYFGVLARAIQHYGGTVDKYIGDAVMAVFGAPTSHEDDGIRAIRAALAIQRSAQSLNATLEKTYGIKIAIRIGINTGEVVAGLLPGEVLAYTVTGDAVNTAQRIETAAPPDGVLISESTRALARSAFFYEDVPPLILKGKSEPVPVYRVMGPERRASPRGGPKIVGREAELASLFAYYRDALAGRGQVVHVHGEAGVGKTRLVAELLSGLPAGAARLRARANSYEQATPYALVAELVRRMLAIAATDDERTARAALAANEDLASGEAAATLLLELLGYEVRSPLDPAGKRRLIVSLLREAVKRRAAAAPLVMVIEDLHWRDASSAGVIAEVTSAVAQLRCLFISTSREPTDLTWAAETIALDALPPAAASELVDRLSAVPIGDAMRALILERTAGNPFFIEEVVRSVRPGKELTVPATVQDLLEARLDALDASPRNVARGAAVIGRTFWERVLARVTPQEDLGPALGTLEREHFVNRVIMAEPAYSFAHALVQEVAYRTQLIAHRRRTHVVVGDAFTDLFGERIEEFIDTLAFHYRRGDDDPKAVRWLLRAGHRAQRLYANAEALDYFRAAIDRSAGDPVGRVAGEEGVGDVLRVTGGYVDALASYHKALESIPSTDRLSRGRLLRKTGVIQHLRGDTDAALRLFESLLADLPDDGRSERARVLQNIGEVRWRQGRYDDAVGSLISATVEAETARDDDALAEAFKQLGSAYLLKGDIDSSVRCYQRSLALYDALGDALGEANALNNIGAALRRQSQLSGAVAAYERSLAIRERIGDQLGITHSRNNLGEIHYLRGNLELAEANFAAAAEISESIGYIGLARVGLGATRVELGNREAGRGDLLAAVAELERAGNLTYLADALRDLAQAFLPEEIDAALAWADRAHGVARELGSAEKIGAALTVLGRVRLARGELDGAIAALEDARRVLEQVAERQELARAMASLARGYRVLPTDDPRRGRADALEMEARKIFREIGAELDLRRMDG
jgi:adenylate cyclase